jgi:RimJ/RimL family protein N-acetyltransferase
MAESATLSTERLLLRPFTEADAEAFYKLCSDPLILQYTGDPGVKSVEEAREGLRTRTLADYRKYGYGRLACVLRADGALIGFAGLKYLPELDEVDLGYRLLPAHWGRGLATEASRAVLDHGLGPMGLIRIIALVEPENVRSVRVVEKLGMVREGVMDYRGARVVRYAAEKAPDR